MEIDILQVEKGITLKLKFVVIRHGNWQIDRKSQAKVSSKVHCV